MADDIGRRLQIGRADNSLALIGPLAFAFAHFLRFICTRRRLADPFSAQVEIAQYGD